MTLRDGSDRCSGIASTVVSVARKRNNVRVDIRCFVACWVGDRGHEWPPVANHVMSEYPVAHFEGMVAFSASGFA